MQEKIRDYIRKHIKRPSDWTESNPLDFNPTRTKIFKYVKSILERYELGKEKDKRKIEALVEYFNVKNIEEEATRKNLVNSNLDADSFSPFAQAINSKHKKPSELRTLRFVCALFEIELPAHIAESNIESQTALEKELTRNIRKLYLEHEDFTQIQVVGDIENKCQTLNMEDYYMDLSYLEREDIEARDSLLLKEKESFRNKISQNNIPHNYISNSILANENRVVIMGNPGTGKSTFARWLCHHWAKSPKADQPILVYIGLRELNLNQNNEVIEEYFQNNYLKQCALPVSKSDISLFLSNPKQVRLVLDGLDELSDKRKNLLNTQLALLQQQNSYILLSRPYALFDNCFQQTASIEIIGYNNSSRTRYIENMLAQKDPNKKEDLLEMIQANPVLNDLSYNPLMLSYLSLLFLDDEVENKLMAEIESTYQLQELVLGWLKSYSSQRNGKAGKFIKHAKKSEELADYLELRQEFVYYSRSFDDGYSEVTDKLSKAGLGRKDVLNNHGDWKFHFQTITTQEYLAAKYVGKKINAEAFIYVAQKQIFWNYAKMILGYKSLHGDHEFIRQVLQLVDQYHQETNKIYYKYLYFSLLSEVGTSQLNAMADQKLITDLLYYHDYSMADKRWHSLIGDAIGRIYAKLKPDLKKAFSDHLIERIQENFSLYIKHQQSAVLAPTRSLFRLITKLNLHIEPNFVKAIPKLILDSINLNADENKDGNDLNLMFVQLLYTELENFLILLEQSPKELIPTLHNDLKTIYSKVSQDSLKQSIERITHYFDSNNSNVDEYHEFNKIILNWDNTQICEEELEDSLIEICQQCQKIAICFSGRSEDEKKQVLELFINCHRIIEDSTLDDQLLLNDLFEALHKANCDLKAESFDADLYFLDKNHLLDIRYFSKEKTDRFLKQCLTQLNDKPELFENAFYIVATQAELPYQYLDIYLELIQNKIINLKLEDLLGEMEEEQYESIRFPLQQVKMIAEKDHTRWLVLSKVMNMKLRNNEVFKRECLPDIMRNSEFHAAHVWEIIMELASIGRLRDKLIEILMNKELYLYPSNIEAILSIWKILTGENINDSEEIKTSDLANLHQACYFFLSRLKKLNYTIPKSLLENLYATVIHYQSHANMAEIDEFYMHELVSAKKQNPFYIAWENEWQEGKVLYITSCLNQLLIGEILEQKKNIYPNYQKMSAFHQNDFKSQIIQLFTAEELKELKTSLGSDLYQEILDYVHEQNLYNKAFDPKLYIEKMNPTIKPHLA